MQHEIMITKNLKQHELEQVAGGYNFKDFWKEMGNGFSDAGDALK